MAYNQCVSKIKEACSHISSQNCRNWLGMEETGVRVDVLCVYVFEICGNSLCGTYELHTIYYDFRMRGVIF